MNRENYATALVAILCICAVGFSATSLEHALGTDPDDVVDLEYEKLPIGKQDAGNLEKEVQSNKEEGQGAGGGGDGPSAQSDGAGDTDSQSQSGDGGGSAANSAEDGSGSGQTAGSETSGGPGAGILPGLSRGALSSLFDLLPWLVLLALLALAYRYRRRLLALALALLGVVPGPDEEPAETTPRWQGVEPSNEVHRAWLAMVESLPVERPWTRTPSECAAIARGTGADPEAVASITETFEEVRYGGRPVTDERRARAREGIERLRNRGEGQ